MTKRDAERLAWKLGYIRTNRLHHKPSNLYHRLLAEWAEEYETTRSLRDDA